LAQRIFDFIDADDAWVASYLLDVYRLAASLSVLAKDEGASPYEAVVSECELRPVHRRTVYGILARILVPKVTCYV
jgi:hypothetical protein